MYALCAVHFTFACTSFFLQPRNPLQPIGLIYEQDTHNVFISFYITTGLLLAYLTLLDVVVCLFD